MLSRLAQEFADEIANHDWSDAPYRLDRAGTPANTTPTRPPRSCPTARRTRCAPTSCGWQPRCSCMLIPTSIPTSSLRRAGAEADHPQQRRS